MKSIVAILLALAASLVFAQSAELSSNENTNGNT